MNLLDQLTISDPLEKQDVNIIITLPASEKAKDERPALISVGMANQMPVIKTGVLGSVDDLLHQAWKEFGVQAEAAKAQAGAQPVEEDDDASVIDETDAAPQLLAEATITDEAPEPAVEAEVVAETAAPLSKPKPAPAAPKPAAFLDLF